MTESQLQQQCVQWLQVQHKDLLFYAVPNEGKRSYALANHMKTMGLRSGIPDIVICKANHGFHGLYIELKVGKNKLTKNQSEVLTKLKEEGYLAIEVRDSFEEFQVVVNSYVRGD